MENTGHSLYLFDYTGFEPTVFRTLKTILKQYEPENEIFFINHPGWMDEIMNIFSKTDNITMDFSYAFGDATPDITYLSTIDYIEKNKWQEHAELFHNYAQRVLNIMIKNDNFFNIYKLGSCVGLCDPISKELEFRFTILKNEYSDENQKRR